MKITVSQSGIEMRYIINSKRFSWSDLESVSPNIFNGDPVLVFKKTASYSGNLDKVVEKPIGHDKTMALMFWSQQWSKGSLREAIERYMPKQENLRQ